MSDALSSTQIGLLESINSTLIKILHYMREIDSKLEEQNKKIEQSITG